MYCPKPPRRLTPFSTSALLLLLTAAGLLWGFPRARGVSAAGASAPYLAAFVVTNTNDAGAGSLRQAILDANSNPGTDSISFNIPGAGVHTIKPLSPLPVIDGTVNIDGYKQPGAAPNSLGTGNNAVLLVELDGSAAGTPANGLEITGNTVSVSGLVINRFAGHGILFNGGAEGGVGGCFIGTNATGTAALGNTGHGVAFIDSNSGLVGGTTAGESNLIAGNGGDGVHVEESAGGDADLNFVQGNRIGLGGDGGALPNAGNGVYISGDSCVVGGENAGEGNEIAFNGGDGVEVAGGLSNAVRGNSIRSNAGLGIELRDAQPDGTVTPNDSFDGDAGPNNLQNFPVVDSATSTINGTTIAGTLDTLPGLSGFRIDLYSSPSCDPSGNGEGQTYLGSTTAATGDDGHGTFNVSLPAAVTVGHVVTATTTTEDQNTSEFSPCRVVAAPTFTWNGSADTDWHNGANWDTGTAPTASDIAVIPSAGVTNEPTISAADAAVSTLTVQAGRTLSIASGRTLTSGTTSVNAGGALNVPAAQTGTLAGALTLDGALTGGDATSTFRFDGATLTNNGTVSVAALRFGGSAQTLSGTGAITSSKTNVLAGATVTLGSDHALGALAIDGGGTFSQGASFNLSVGPLTVAQGGAFRNVGTGDLTLGGGVSNDGALTLDGGGAACGDADSILLRSSAAGVQRAWSGAGTFSLADVDVRDQAGTAPVAVRSGTNSGNNGANWTFTVCPASSTLTVNTTDDGDDGACNAAHCSLREAILTSNSTPGQVEIIAFNIGGGGAQTISPASALPTVTNPVNIDGTTQPGFGGVPLVELNGAGAGGAASGLTITSGGCTVRGLTINRFGGHGIRLVSSGFNTVAGNFIGTNAAGTAAQANAGSGISIDVSPNNNIGGTTAAERNVISGNAGHGVLIGGANSNSNRVRGNFIGTDLTGSVALGNSGSGVAIVGGNSHTVGGAAAGSGNLIAFNGGDGVSVGAAGGTANRVLSNSIHTNGTTAQHLGIDLDADGVSPNDPGDLDAGANNLQNFPLINSAASDGATTNVNGALNSKASTVYRVEFFSNATCDASGNGEGAQLLGSADVTADGSGNAAFNVSLPNVAVGQFITSTATDPLGSTSEFSACRAVVAATYSLSGRVTDAGAQPLVGVNVRLSGSAGADTTTDFAGNYSFVGLPHGGSFTVTPSETGYRFTPPSRAVNNLQGDQTGLDFAGTFITYTVTGRVVDVSGAGLPGVNVTLAGARSAVALTDAGGNYTFAGVPAGGGFVVTPERDGFSFDPPNFVITDINADVRFDPVGNAQTTPTPTPDPSDDFEGGPAPDPNRWAKGNITNPPSSFEPLVGVFVQGGLLHVQPRADANGPSFGGLVSAHALDLNSTPLVSVEVVQAARGGAAQTAFGLGAGADHWVRFVVQGAAEPTAATKAHAEGRAESSSAEQTLLFQLNLGGEKFSASVTYDPAQHRFWRFRHDAPARLVIFETSPDSVAWTERFRAQLPADQAALIAELSAGTSRASSNPGEALFDNFLVSPSPRVQFETSAFVVRESDGSARVNVVRTGGDESPLSVAYATAGGTASAGSDYAPVSGTLLFRPGERLKSFDVPVFDDDLTEGGETIGVTLSNPAGGRLGAIARAALTILDDESENPINDTTFFVRQHYLDFLNREPDPEGLQFWVDNIRQCGADLQCREVKRINVSAAFFLSIEFQGTGFFVQRLYRLSYGRAPLFAEYLPDLTAVREGVIVGQPGALERLELNKRLFAEQFVKRAAFKAKFDTQNEAQYVDALAAAAGVTLPEEERTALVVGLLTHRETRADVLLKMAEKEAFVRAEFRPAFVQMQYFGYLRRDPDAEGFNFWLKKLNDFGGDYIRAEMIKAFITSIEYRQRFGQP
ncbi:MAG TPA: Calx-beta domain-containing protein [Pyrinomonadaceae bacterium]|jgi:CSLREA domain-containing protein